MRYQTKLKSSTHSIPNLQEGTTLNFIKKSNTLVPLSLLSQSSHSTLCQTQNLSLPLCLKAPFRSCTRSIQHRLMRTVQILISILLSTAWHLLRSPLAPRHRARVSCRIIHHTALTLACLCIPMAAFQMLCRVRHHCLPQDQVRALHRQRHL